MYGLKIDKIDDVLCLTLDKSKGSTYLSMFDLFLAWQKESEEPKNGEITKDEYDTWRYNYPASRPSASKQILMRLELKRKSITDNTEFFSVATGSRYISKLSKTPIEEVSTINIKYIGNDTKKSENGKIHAQKGNYTGCGARIDDNPQDWVKTSQSVTCDKNGCKN